MYLKNIWLPERAEYKVDEVKIGVGITATEKEIIEQYQAVIDYLNKYSNDKWYLVPLKDYGTFITEMKFGQIKAGFMGSAVAYRIMKEGLILPVARGEKEGISVYYGYIFTRKDSGLNKVEDLKDKKFAYVDIYTSAGYLFPQRFLKNKGYNPDEFFKISSFLGSHEKAILAVLNEEYDGGAAKDSSWRKLAKKNHNLEKELQVLAREGPFPEQTFMISAEFGEKKIYALRKLLLGMVDSEEGREYLNRFGADRFIITETEDFQVVEKIFEF